jgi:hypothetical protein
MARPLGRTERAIPTVLAITRKGAKSDGFGSEEERRRNTRDGVCALGEECPKRTCRPLKPEGL